jgi:hypothetical protein
MCFFKNSPLDLIAKFVDNILESENPENEDLKNILLIKIKEVKDEEEFMYQMPEDVEKKYKNKKIKYEPKKKEKKSLKENTKRKKNKKIRRKRRKNQRMKPKNIKIQEVNLKILSQKKIYSYCIMI